MIKIDSNKMQSVIETAVKKALSTLSLPGFKPTLPGLESKNFIYGIPALADVLGCSYNEARNLKRNNHIPFVAVGHAVKFYLPDIIYAIDHDPLVSTVCTKEVYLDSKPAASLPVRIPRITIESDLISDALPILLVRYQGWRCYVCVPEDIYQDHVEFHEFVKTIILLQHKKRPFMISPNFSDPHLEIIDNG